MNVYDFEWLVGLLEVVGYWRVIDGFEVDVVVFNICVVCENVDNRLYGNFSYLVLCKCVNFDM